MGEEVSDPQTISFFIPSTPIPMGSATGYYIEKINRVVITPANKKTTGWKLRVSHEAKIAADKYIIDNGRPFFAPSGFPVDVVEHFFFDPPVSKCNTKWLYPHVSKFDLDKLARALHDGMTHVLYHDDSQINVIQAKKFYTTPEQPMSGVRVTLTIGLDKIPNPTYVKGNKVKP